MIADPDPSSEIQRENLDLGDPVEPVSPLDHTDTPAYPSNTSANKKKPL